MSNTTFIQSDGIDIKLSAQNPGDPITEPKSPDPNPQKNPEIEPEKIPEEDPGIQPGTQPDEDDDDDDPFTETEIGDDPDEIQKKTTIM